jgi:hypothetical protein
VVTLSVVIPYTTIQETPQQTLSLAVESVILLRNSAMPPHFTLCNPHQDSVLIGLDSASCAEGDGTNTARGEEIIHINCHKGDGKF